MENPRDKLGRFIETNRFANDELVDLYWNKGRSLSEVAQTFDVDVTVVLYWMKKHNIRRRTISEANAMNPLISKKDLKDFYYEKKLTLKEIGERCGVTLHVIYYWMKKYGLKGRSNSESHKNRTYNPSGFSKKEFEELYIKERKSSLEIGTLLDIGKTTVLYWLKKFGIERRTASEALKGKFCGEENWNWEGGYEPYYGPNWAAQREKALRRDRYECQRCRATDDLIVHHIVPFRKTRNNSLSNLQTLCHSCHSKVEAQRRWIK